MRLVPGFVGAGHICVVYDGNGWFIVFSVSLSYSSRISRRQDEMNKAFHQYWIKMETSIASISVTLNYNILFKI